MRPDFGIVKRDRASSPSGSRPPPWPVGHAPLFLAGGVEVAQLDDGGYLAEESQIVDAALIEGGGGGDELGQPRWGRSRPLGESLCRPGFMGTSRLARSTRLGSNPGLPVCGTESRGTPDSSRSLRGFDWSQCPAVESIPDKVGGALRLIQLQLSEDRAGSGRRYYWGPWSLSRFETAETTSYEVIRLESRIRRPRDTPRQKV